MAPNLCRCGTHMRILRAVRARPRRRAAACSNAAEDALMSGLTPARGCSAAAARWSSAFSLPRAAQAAGRRRSPPLPGSLEKTPLLDAWIRIDADGAITVFTGKAELGQGHQDRADPARGRGARRGAGQHRLDDRRHRAARPTRASPPAASRCGQRHRGPQRRGPGARAADRDGGDDARRRRRETLRADGGAVSAPDGRQRRLWRAGGGAIAACRGRSRSRSDAPTSVPADRHSRCRASTSRRR